MAEERMETKTRSPGSSSGAVHGVPRRVRIADVAKEAGVSKTAVSFAFNSPERLNHATAARIRRIAEELGYRPHPVSRMVTAKRTMTIGLLTPQVLSVVFANPFYAELCAGVASTTDQAGYGLLFVSPLQGSLIRAIARASVDGFVAVGLSEDHPEVEQIRRASLPMVLVDGGALPEHGLVESNDEVGARAAARYLAGLGHRDFIVVGVEPPNMPGLVEYSAGPTETVASRRLTGYRQGLELSGIRLRDDQIVVGPATFDGGVAAFRGIWEDGLRPTAVLAMSDVMAIGVMWAIREAGLEVPRDISIVGFDDLDVAPHSNPPLTTVHQPVRAKGEEAARLLLRMIAHPDNERPEHKTLDTRLIIRGSTGPARGPAQNGVGPGKGHGRAPGVSRTGPASAPASAAAEQSRPAGGQSEPAGTSSPTPPPRSHR
jgi:DNA-binding LacI/PurR family transcriptional regulator